MQAEGSASLLLSDTNGSVTLDLSSAGAFLEGMGGNPAQLEYLESQNPGFSTSDWHTYRIFIEEDSGNIVASLSIDGTEVGSRNIGPIALNRVMLGDLAGTANGRLDVDFFRFDAVMSILLGDANNDGIVDGTDLLAV